MPYVFIVDYYSWVHNIYPICFRFIYIEKIKKNYLPNKLYSEKRELLLAKNNFVQLHKRQWTLYYKHFIKFI